MGEFRIGKVMCTFVILRLFSWKLLLRHETSQCFSFVLRSGLWIVTFTIASKNRSNESPHRFGQWLFTARAPAYQFPALRSSAVLRDKNWPDADWRRRTDSRSWEAVFPLQRKSYFYARIFLAVERFTTAVFWFIFFGICCLTVAAQETLSRICDRRK